MKRIFVMLIIFLILVFLTKSIYAVTIVLDPGHGGTDTGAINHQLGLYERNQVWKIANYLKEYLEEYKDTKVYLTCPTLKTTGDVIPREDRADIMKKYNADLAISLHIDSSTSPNPRGATAFVTALPKYNSSMKTLANLLLNNLTKLGIKSNGVKTRGTESNDGYYSDGTPLDYYGIIRYPTLHDIPIVLLEHCFISNLEDCKFVDSDDDLKKLAKSDADAISSYLKLSKKVSVTPTPTKTPTVSKDTSIDGVTFSNLNIEKGFITNILAGEKVKNLKSRVKTSYTVTITDKDGKLLSDTDTVKNVSKLIIKDKEKIIATFIITIYGDLNCDGIINSIDLLVLQRHIIGVSRLDENSLKAGNISKDGSSPTSIDLLKIQRHILGISQIK